MNFMQILILLLIETNVSVIRLVKYIVTIQILIYIYIYNRLLCAIVPRVYVPMEK